MRTLLRGGQVMDRSIGDALARIEERKGDRYFVDEGESEGEEFVDAGVGGGVGGVVSAVIWDDRDFGC